VILKFGDDNFHCLAGAIFTVGLWLRPGQHGAGGVEIDAVQVLDQLDDVATNAAATAVENIFLGVDGEAIFAAAPWAWTDKFGADAFKVDAAPKDFFSNRHGPRPRYPAEKLSAAAHDTT
jgi:hypothetical protein